MIVAIVMLSCLGWSVSLRAQSSPTPILVGQAFVNAIATPFWIGIEQGIFAKHGLDVRIVHFRGSTVANQALLTGSIPVLMAGPHSPIAARAKGADILQFATLAPAMPYLFVTRQKLRSYDELKGKIFGVSGLGLSTSYIGAIVALKHFGLDVKRDKITMLATGTESERIFALAQGRIDATVLDSIYGPVIEKAGGANGVIMADIGALNIPWEHDVLLSTGKFMKERPETIENLLKGYLEANAFILNPANGEIVKKSIVKNLGDKMGDGSVAYKQIVALFVKAKPYSNRKGVQLIIDEVKNLNPEAATLKVDDFVDDSVLQKLDKSGFIDSLYKGRKIPK
jgi:NitT/TauT family transport system substrate-binding protein